MASVRPVESAVAWKYGVERQDGPTALILSRQNLAQQERTEEQLANIARGGYVLKIVRASRRLSSLRPVQRLSWRLPLTKN